MRRITGQDRFDTENPKPHYLRAQDINIENSRFIWATEKNMNVFRVYL